VHNSEKSPIFFALAFAAIQSHFDRRGTISQHQIGQHAGKREEVTPIGAQPMRSLRRILSHASWALPVLSFVPLIASVARTGQHPSVAATDLSVVMIVTGSCCGIIALIGIPWWGDNDWVVAAVGLAFSIFIFLVAACGLQ
jgi:hypothetical protein